MAKKAKSKGFFALDVHQFERIRQSTTLAEVLECLEDKNLSPEVMSRPNPNVVSLCQYRQQKRQEAQ